MSTPRISLGASIQSEARIRSVSVYGLAGTHYRMYLEDYATEEDFGQQMELCKWADGDEISVISPEGVENKTSIATINYNASYIDVSITMGERADGSPIFLPAHAGYKVIRTLDKMAFSVSVPGVDVTNTWHAHTGNLIFDTSGFTEGAMYAVQTGSFVLAGYKHRHDPTFHAGNRTNVSISIAETKPEGQELDIPIVLMQFAVCNSSGYFHPNYADSANAQVLGYMDSIWVKQLNVIGGTLNTESISVRSSRMLPYYRDGGFYPRYELLSDYHMTHWISKPNYDYVGTTPPVLRDNPDHYTTETSWEVLHRPDNPGAVSGGVRASYGQGGDGPPPKFWTHGSRQSQPPYGLLSTPDDKYSTFSVGRTGYWKQKTWGLIYYVDHKKIIVQAFNDKSTANAMIKAGSTMHRDAYNNDEGDLGRVIGTMHDDFDITWSTGNKTGGAFNHNLYHSGDYYNSGNGCSIFDYYHTNGPSEPSTQHSVSKGYFGEVDSVSTPWNNTNQSHMPRAYLGGYDNMMWDNVPLHTTFDVGGKKPTFSPWMSLSGVGLGEGDVGGIPAIDTWIDDGTALYSESLRVMGSAQGGVRKRGEGFGYTNHANWYTWFNLHGSQGMASTWGGPSYAVSGGYGLRPWYKTTEMPERCGTLSYREAIAPNTEVTTILTNHFNPLSGDMHGGEALDINGNPQGWDYFFVSYVVFNQSTGVRHDSNLKQMNTTGSANWAAPLLEGLPDQPHPTGLDHIHVPEKPIEPWTGQPLHD